MDKDGEKGGSRFRGIRSTHPHSCLAYFLISQQNSKLPEVAEDVSHFEPGCIRSNSLDKHIEITYRSCTSIFVISIVTSGNFVIMKVHGSINLDRNK